MTRPADNPVAKRALALAMVAGLVAFGLACAVFWSFDDPWTLRGDNKAVLYPMNLDAFRSWMSGRAPEWTDKFWSGFPLLADPTSMSLYWPNYLGFLLTPEPHFRAYDLATALHSGILVSGVVYLLRILGVRPLAALFGGLLIFVAPMHVWYASSMITGYAPVAWWPWILVAAELLSRRGLALGPLVLGWISLASCALVYPEFALYGGTTAAAWLLTRNLRPFYERVLCVIALGIGGLAMAAPQLVPTLLFFPETTRGAGLGQLRPLDITQIFFSANTFLYPSAKEFIPSFIGVATLLIATAGALSRKPRTVFLVGLVLISFVLALGGTAPLYAWLRALPGFGLFRQAMKFKLLTELAIVLLAAFGLDHLLRRNADPRGRRFVALIVALALTEHFSYLALRVPTGVGLPGADDISFAKLYERMIDSNVVRLALAGQRNPVPRINDRMRLRSIPAIEGVPTLRGGPNALLPERHRRILRSFNLPPGPTRAEMNYMDVQLDVGDDPGSTPTSRNPCLDEVAGRGLLLVGRRNGTCVFRNRDRPSRFVVASGVRRAENLDSMIAEVTQELSGGRVTVTLERPEDSCPAVPALSTEAMVGVALLGVSDQIPVVAPQREIERRSRPFGRAGVVDYRPGDVDLVTVANRPAFLIVKESYFDGWRATVDFEPVPTYPAAGLFFAVPIPSGQHEIHLEYRSPGFRTGVRVTLVWITAVCVIEMIRRMVSARREAAR